MASIKQLEQNKSQMEKELEQTKLTYEVLLSDETSVGGIQWKKLKFMLFEPDFNQKQFFVSESYVADLCRVVLAEQ